MKSLHFAIGTRTKGTQKGAAQAHVRYIMRTPDQAADHAAYVTRSSGQVREDLVATGTGNLPDWAAGDPIAFFTEADRWERANGRTATQITAALASLVDAAIAAGTIRSNVDTEEVLRAMGAVWSVPAGSEDQARRVLLLVMDRLRHGAGR